MKYIIMCGGRYQAWQKVGQTPKQLTQINGVTLLERNIQLLRQNAVDDIAISSNNPIFGQFGLPLLQHNNQWNVDKEGQVVEGTWVNGFYPMDEPICYLFGDVVYSPYAIKTIVETKTNDIEFFASSPPFNPQYIKRWAEPFAFKVVNTDHFKKSIEEVKRLQKDGRFKRAPIAWEFWQVIKGTPINYIDYHNYVVINDYTCDIDYPKDIELIERYVK